MENNMSWWKKVSKFFGMITVRNRDARVRYLADDPSTPEVDEAYTKVYKTPKGAFKNKKKKSTTGKKIELSARQKQVAKTSSRKKKATKE